MEYTKEMIVENTNVEEVENYGRFQNDMIKLSITINKHILEVIELIGVDKFNDMLHKERLDSYIENGELVDYFLDKEHEFNGDITNDTKYILISDAIDSMNKILNNTIFDDVEFIETDEDEIKLYYEFGNMDILNNISKVAAGFIMSAKHVAYDIEEVNGLKYFVLSVDIESFEESLSTL